MAAVYEASASTGLCLAQGRLSREGPVSFSLLDSIPDIAGVETRITDLLGYRLFLQVCKEGNQYEFQVKKGDPTTSGHFVFLVLSLSL